MSQFDGQLLSTCGGLSVTEQSPLILHRSTMHRSTNEWIDWMMLAASLTTNSVFWYHNARTQRADDLWSSRAGGTVVMVKQFWLQSAAMVTSVNVDLDGPKLCCGSMNCSHFPHQWFELQPLQLCLRWLSHCIQTDQPPFIPTEIPNCFQVWQVIAQKSQLQNRVSQNYAFKSVISQWSHYWNVQYVI